ncbi:MAG TPA: SigE family RNA polymerase sigma factor [Nocardioidaceae bacterium]|nr:SigE family RNA polymerase sigma factor [Nocardioidaceae bacterium]
MNPPEEFAEYAAARWPDLVRTARFAGCQPSDAEDVAQEALIRCLKAWGKVTSARDREAYVYRILFNCIRDHMRKHRRESPSNLIDSAVSDFAEGVLEEQNFLTLLDRLPGHQREVLILRYFVGLSEAEVAIVLNAPLGTVKSRAARGVEGLKAVLRRPGGAD